MRARLLRGIAAFRNYRVIAAFFAATTGVLVPSAGAHPAYNCTAWSAWIDRAPSAGAMPTLHLRGKCAFHVAGHYDLEFKPHRPSSTDPKVLLLDFVVRTPPGASGA